MHVHVLLQSGLTACIYNTCNCLIYIKLRNSVGIQVASLRTIFLVHGPRDQPQCFGGAGFRPNHDLDSLSYTVM